MMPQLIEKEQIQFLTFPKNEVLTEFNDKIDRIHELKRAMVLGNIERHKVRITFEDIECIKSVETTIWGITDNAVILKNSIIIPLKRILKIA